KDVARELTGRNVQFHANRRPCDSPPGKANETRSARDAAPPLEQERVPPLASTRSDVRHATDALAPANDAKTVTKVQGDTRGILLENTRLQCPHAGCLRAHDEFAHERIANPPTARHARHIHADFRDATVHLAG